MLNGPITIFTGNANRELAIKISNYLEIPLCDANVGRFSDGEVLININESVRGHHTFVVQPTCPPVHENLMEMLVIIDALKRASASEITAVVPYYGYARQDRKAAPRQPITAKLIADLFHAAGATRMISLDLHAAQIQGFFNVPVDHLLATPIFMEDLRNRFCETEAQCQEVVIVSPDAGGVERARAYAKRLQVGLAIIDKRRPSPGIAQVMNIIGDVKGKRAIIIDDMIDTAGTLAKSVEAIMTKGALEVLAYATHAVFSGPAIDNIEQSALKEVVVTDSVPLKDNAKACSRIRVLSCAPLVAEAMRRMHTGASISTLFE